MKNLWNKYIWAVGADLRMTKDFDHENNPIDRHDYNTHNICFLLILIFGVIYFVDYELGLGWLFYGFAELIGKVPEELNDRNAFSIFMILAWYQVLLISFISFIFYRVKVSKYVNPIDFFPNKRRNVYLSRIIMFFGSALGFLMMNFGGLLIGSMFFERFNLDHVTGSLVLQIIIIAKTSALACWSSCRFFQMIYP